MNLTPTQIAALVAPLWAKRPELRPTKQTPMGNVWSLVFIPAPCSAFCWQLSQNINHQECDDAAAVAIEFAIDRALEAEAKKLGAWIRASTLNTGETEIEVISIGLVHAASVHASRLVAKAKLLAAIWSVHLPGGEGEGSW